MTSWIQPQPVRTFSVEYRQSRSLMSSCHSGLHTRKCWLCTSTRLPGGRCSPHPCSPPGKLCYLQGGIERPGAKTSVLFFSCSEGAMLGRGAQESVNTLFRSSSRWAKGKALGLRFHRPQAWSSLEHSRAPSQPPWAPFSGSLVKALESWLIHLSGQKEHSFSMRFPLPSLSYTACLHLSPGLGETFCMSIKGQRS